LDESRVTVPLSGSPRAIAHLIQGGLRADHGSHFGFKAIVDDSLEGIDHEAVFPLVHGSALNTLTRAGQIIDRSWFQIVDDQGQAFSVVDRSVHFEPWSIQETLKAENLGVIESEACNVGLNVSLYRVRVRNQSDESKEIGLRMNFDCDPDPIRERLDEIDSNSCPLYTAHASPTAGLTVGMTGKATGHRRIITRFVQGSSGNGLAVTATAITHDGQVIIEVPKQQVYAGAQGSFVVIIATGQGQEEADESYTTYDLSFNSNKPMVACAFEKEKFQLAIDEMDLLVGGLQHVTPLTTEREIRLQRLAVDALRHARYATRGEMGPRSGIVPAKPVQVRFEPEKMARIQSVLGMLDPMLPIEVAQVMTKAAYRQEGRLPPVFDENLQPAVGGTYVANPILAWALTETVGLRSDFYTTVEIDPLYQGIARIISYLEDSRARGPGFYTYRKEAGVWEDSPRFIPETGVADEDVYDVLRTTWVARAYLDMATLASAMSLDGESAPLKQRGDELLTNLQTIFFDAESGLYVDQIAGEGEHPSPIHTPASLFPTALGMGHPEGHEGSAAFILDGDGLWGTWQGSTAYMMAIPSIAYDDPYLNVYQDGHRMRGQVWPWQVYMAWRTLLFAGRYEEAENLRDRFLRMIDKNSDLGLFETYDFFDGRPGLGPQGMYTESVLAPPVMQHSVTAAAVLRLLHRF
jgi:hypothetical protein